MPKKWLLIFGGAGEFRGIAKIFVFETSMLERYDWFISD